MKRATSFRFLWFGQMVANLADVLYVVVLIAMVYQATGSTMLTALIPMVTMGAQLIGGLVAPLVLDRFRLSRLLVSTQVGKALLFALLTLFLDRLLSGGWLPLLYVLMALFSILDAAANPARNAIVPRLVEKAELVKVNGWLASTDQTVNLAGWALGGVVFVALGGTESMWVCFALHAVAALLMFGVREPVRTAEASEEHIVKSSGISSMKEGWVVLWRTPLLRTILIMDVIEVMSGGVWVGAVMMVFVQEALGEGEQWFGFLNAGYMGGMLLGGLLVSLWAKQVERRFAPLLVLSSAVFAALNLLFAYTSIAWLAVLLCLLMGPPNQMKEVIQQTLIQRTVEERLLPKVFSAKMTVFYTGYTLSVLVMSLLTDWIGVRSVYALAGAIVALVPLLAWSRWKVLRQASVL